MPDELEKYVELIEKTPEAKSMVKSGSFDNYARGYSESF